jgi:hypothetical protein
MYRYRNNKWKYNPYYYTSSWKPSHGRCCACPGRDCVYFITCSKRPRNKSMFKPELKIENTKKIMMYKRFQEKYKREPNIIENNCLLLKQNML